jgi:hypothetical protein
MPDPTIVSNPDLAAQVAQLNSVLAQVSAFLSHVSVSGATAHALEWAKGKPTIAKWWDLLSGRGKVIVGGLLAAAGSLGISTVFSHDPKNAGVYTVVISGLTLPSVGSHLWSFAQSWVLQQGWYSGLIKPRTVTGVPSVAGVTPKPQTPVPVVEVPAAQGGV